MLAVISRINPFYSIATLSIPLFISIFFGMSSGKAVKNFLAWFSLFFLFLAIFLNIYGFRIGGNFSDQLFSFSIPQVVSISIILFSSLNILLFIYLLQRDNEHFVKILISFLFSVCLCILVVISRNFLMLFISLAIFLVFVFQLITSLNGWMEAKGSYTVKLFLSPFLAMILFFFSFSMIYGSTDFKNFTQIVEAELVPAPFAFSGVIILMVGVYLYLFLFPFQGSYLKFMRKCEYSSFSIIYFLYFLAGIFVLAKLNEVIYYLAEKYSNATKLTLLVVCFICLTSSNLGALKSRSLRRILSFILLFHISLFLLNYAMFSFGLIDKGRVEWLIIANLLLLVVNFFPLYGLLVFMEKYSDSDSIVNLNGLVRKNTYLSINTIIVLLSLCGVTGTVGYLARYYYIGPFIYHLVAGDFLGFGIASLVLMVLVIFSFGFLAVNIFRIIINLFRRPGDKSKKISKEAGSWILFPRFYYVYVTFFTLIILFIGIAGLLEIVNTGISGPGWGFKITDSSIFLPVSGN